MREDESYAVEIKSSFRRGEFPSGFSSSRAPDARNTTKLYVEVLIAERDGRELVCRRRDEIIFRRDEFSRTMWE